MNKTRSMSEGNFQISKKKNTKQSASEKRTKRRYTHNSAGNIELLFKVILVFFNWLRLNPLNHHTKVDTNKKCTDFFYRKILLFFRERHHIITSSILFICWMCVFLSFHPGCPQQQNRSSDSCNLDRYSFISIRSHTRTLFMIKNHVLKSLKSFSS